MLKAKSMANDTHVSTVRLVTGVDDGYSKPLAVMLLSAERNLKQGCLLEVCVLDGGVSRRNKARIIAPLNPQTTTVTWIDMTNCDLVRGAPVFGHVSVATYFRVVLGPLLPASWEKVIYLDADTLVTGDLTELWELPMEGNTILAVQEADLTIGFGGGIPEYEKMGLSPDMPLFNAGVFVADLRKWRDDQVGERVMDYLRRNYKDVMFWDQDGLNAVLARKVGLIPRRWNYRVDCAYEGESGVPDGVIRENVRRDSAIVHFASAVKPWHFYANHPAKELFFDILQNTSWRGWRPRTPLRALRNPHYWGQLLRATPFFGNIWRHLRSGGSLWQRRAHEHRD